MAHLQFTLWINSSPESVYQVITNLSGYTSWLPASNLFRETKTLSESTLKVGTHYIDQGPVLAMHGEVTELKPYSSVAFRQVALMSMLDLRMRYTLQPKDGGTQMLRELTIHTKGLMLLFQPILVRVIGREDDRLMEELKRYVETR